VIGFAKAGFLKKVIDCLPTLPTGRQAAGRQKGRTAYTKVSAVKKVLGVLKQMLLNIFVWFMTAINPPNTEAIHLRCFEIK